MLIQKSLFAIAASLLTMIAFSSTVAVMTVEAGAGFPVRATNHELA